MKNADKLKVVIVNSFRARVFTLQEVKAAWESVYPDSPFKKQSFRVYCVNMKSSKSRLEKHKFLFRVKKGEYRIYDHQRDGRWRRVSDHMEQMD